MDVKSLSPFFNPFFNSICMSIYHAIEYTGVGFILILENRYSDKRMKNSDFLITYPALRTAPVQLKDAAAVPVAFALYGDAMILSPSSSSDIAVVKLIRSSSLICKNVVDFFCRHRC